ncbi:MAG: hypothetical protein JKY37_05155 [Nannocystaceae bacterium]|nr:hypothetical protein [Nannocystaceae bacterium]
MVKPRKWVVVVGAAVGLLGGYAAGCGDVAAFVCLADSDCVLAKVPGICTDEGHCVYPQADCASGFALPIGSPSDRAGECVTGSTAGGSGSGDGATSPTVTTEPEPGGTTVGTAADDTETSSTNDDLTTDADTSGGSTSGGSSSDDASAQCTDDIGDSAERASNHMLCLPQISSVIDDNDDVDVFRLGGGECAEGVYNANIVKGDVHVCLLLDCDDGFSPMIGCQEGTNIATVFGLTGCCSSDMARAAMSCGANSPGVDVYLVVEPGSKAGQPPDVCEAYTVDVYGSEG